MKIRSPREPILAALQTAAAVVPARSPKPVLTNVKLEATKDSAVLSATDLEVGVRIEIEGVETSAPGAVLLPSGRLAAIVRESSPGTVFEISSDGTATVVKAPRSEFRLPAEDPLEFPSVAAFPQGPCFEISTPLVRELVRRTVFATDNESSRYALGGVLLELSATSVIAVGTDGRRLAKMEGPAEAREGEAPAVQPIVPARAMQLVERCLGAADAPVFVATRHVDNSPTRPTEILVRAGGTTVSSRLVDGRFPRWRDVFPDRPDAVRVSLVAGPLLAAVRQAAIVTSEQSKGVDFSFEQGQLVLFGRSAESGESRVEVPIDHAGATVRIKLDPRFVADFLRVLDGGTNVAVEITDAQSACVCRTEDGYGYVIMPLAAD
ncbi:MAG: DNA polymerase III subunit beta [Planctomycetia bacterium]|nr:DNA polymerase III subunit beta [Planctomycetia bacterium]